MSAAVVESALGTSVSRETVERLAHVVDLVTEENKVQNLVSAASLNAIWARHIADSAQLLRHAPADAGPWLDLGTGAGFPGLVVGVLCDFPVILCEERRLRAAFLMRACDSLGLGHVRVCATRVERLKLPPVATISARAFAPLDKLLTLSHRFSTEKTRWVLPKGQSAAEELATARTKWHGDFRLEPSVTDPNSSIVIAEHVSPKGHR